ncbi:hypothetical protein GPECTOR_30g285 [Gonium pectorale]|uniref:Phosphoinositide phospholipase C n=1 Tax=Gonium pectorale TaxID=33097 RepID=A0A150GEC5_GONPE|nr:hypothetical protein GPECTOR_30g285 [Gonium pectorale]|eukprot:KXZ48189.1 hypothetical protein GPECTOR_30g285 [Gonium pectorale]
MSQPLPCYFISSGHNSYLTGNQLFSASGTATIVKSLQEGCRVIELDCYNGPVCTHGGTLTSAVDFEECVAAIRDSAFVSSPYPVIITMENHANPDNQAKMAAILRRVLGPMLFVPDPDDPRVTYLSPEALRGKVVCRTSRKANSHEEFSKLIYIRNCKFTSFGDMLRRDTVASSSFEETTLPEQRDLQSCGSGIPDVILEGLASESDGDDDGAADPRGAPWLKKPLRRMKTGLYRIAAGADWVPEDALDAGCPPVEGSLQQLYACTCRHLMRVYPAGWRVMSGNYNPMKAWVRGASLAALNWQVWDKALRINQGKFMDNGGCGYVLKPEWMRASGSRLPSRFPGRLHVHVYSAFQYQGRNMGVFKDDLFVRVRLSGMPVDCAKSFTGTVTNSGRLVARKDFYFDVRFPEMAVLYIELMDEDALGGAANHADADTLGYYSLPLASLAEGDFKLNLRSPKSGEPLPLERTWVKAAPHPRMAQARPAAQRRCA